MRELSELEKNPPEGIRIQTSEEDMMDVTGIIEGPGTWLFIYILMTFLDLPCWYWLFRVIRL